jgi:hypothetical protein
MDGMLAEHLQGEDWLFLLSRSPIECPTYRMNALVDIGKATSSDLIQHLERSYHIGLLRPPRG